MLISRLKPLFGAAVAIVVMTAATGAASASRGLTVSNGVPLATATGILTLPGGGPCTVTLVIALGTPITKVAGSTNGTVLPSPASSISCPGRLTGEVLGGTLVHVNFFGVLPLVTGLRVSIRGFALDLRNAGSPICLWSGQVEANITMDAPTGTLETIDLLANRTLVPTAPCTGNGSLNGRLTVQATRPNLDLI